jgi:hypothetical protein
MRQTTCFSKKQPIAEIGRLAAADPSLSGLLVAGTSSIEQS